MLDEAEAITSLTTANRREEANQTLKRLLDNPEQRTGWEVVFATTRRFIDDPLRGARSYPALWERIREAGPPGAFNPRATVLELGPLATSELHELGGHLRDMHATAYDWLPQVSIGEIETIGEVTYGDEVSRPPRRFVRAVISALDLLEADPARRLPDVLAAVEQLGREDE